MTTIQSDALTTKLTALSRASYLFVCVDYDGTLAPIAPRPEQAVMLPGAFDLLNRLAALPNTRVAIVSGRSRDDLMIHTAFEAPIILVGSHGAEGSKPYASSFQYEAWIQLNTLIEFAAMLCRAAPGAWIEHKPFGISVHVRETSLSDGRRILEAIRARAHEYPLLHLIEGKAVLDLCITRSSKGDAVEWLRNTWNRTACVLYAGDDVSDETVFQCLRASDLGLKIGGGATQAEFRLESEVVLLAALTNVACQRRQWIESPRDELCLEGQRH
jgi:trehalose 6-phosphate phosphatase